MADKDDGRRQWFHAFGAIVAVAAVIGAVLGALTYGAVRVIGLAGADAEAEGRHSSRPTSARQMSAAKPKSDDTTARRASPTRTGDLQRERRPHKQPRADDRARDRPGHRASQRHKRRTHHQMHGARHRLTLVANRHRVHRMQHVNLSGRYRGHGGSRLVVQRLERGRWERFPVTVVVRAGRFRTWVASGHRSPNRLRVVDPRTRRASSPVTVRVR